MEKETSFSIHLFYWLCGQLDKGGIHSIQKDVFPFIYFIGCVDNWTKVVFTQSIQTIPLNLPLFFLSEPNMY